MSDYSKQKAYLAEGRVNQLDYNIQARHRFPGRRRAQFGQKPATISEPNPHGIAHHYRVL